MIHKLDMFHKTKLGLFIFGLVELALAYGFVSLSIDRGNVFYYALTLIFLFFALRCFFKLIGKFLNGKK